MNVAFISRGVGREGLTNEDIPQCYHWYFPASFPHMGPPHHKSTLQSFHPERKLLKMRTLHNFSDYLVFITITCQGRELSITSWLCFMGLVDAPSVPCASGEDQRWGNLQQAVLLRGFP